MTEMSAIVAFLQTGTITGWSLVAIGLVGVWKLTAVVPSIIEALEKRNSGIEERLQAGMKATLDRYDAEFEHLEKRLTESDLRHKECEERSRQQTKEINVLKQDIIGFQRQLAAQDIAAAGHLNMENTPATKAMLERLKVIK